MSRYVKLVTVSSLICALSSCTYIYGERGFIQNRDTHYLRAYSTPPLMIPPGLSSSTIQAHYPVAQRHDPFCTRKVNLTPPELAPAPVAKPVRKPAVEMDEEPADVSDVSEPSESKETPAPQVEPKLHPRELESAEASKARQVAHNLVFEPNYYFDRHTRSSVAPGKAITPPFQSFVRKLANLAPKAFTTPKPQPKAEAKPEESNKPIQQAENKTKNPPEPAAEAQNAYNNYTDHFSRH